MGGGKFRNTLKLHNDFIGVDRNILIHNGNSPKDSNGCLLINKVFKDKIQTTIEVDNILQIGKKGELKELIKNEFKKLLK
ncbi:hypothetical protein CQA44_04540 [Helicobacter sp. MIT 14-3879]|nr:hypothetical protein CQA44_04540 [Helicobacter sp. MIT 14-3879]